MDSTLTTALPASWIASRLGVRQADIEGLRERGELFAQRPGETGEWLYPIWQFGQGGTIPAAVRELVRIARARGISEDRVVSLLRRRVGLVGGGRFYDLLFEGRADSLVTALSSL
jgi:hypothetical protein